MTKVDGIRKIMVLWQAVFLAASLLVTAPPSNLTRLYYNGSAAKSHSTITQYRQLRRLMFYQFVTGPQGTDGQINEVPDLEEHNIRKRVIMA